MRGGGGLKNGPQDAAPQGSIIRLSSSSPPSISPRIREVTALFRYSAAVGVRRAGPRRAAGARLTAVDGGRPSS